MIALFKTTAALLLLLAALAGAARALTSRTPPLQVALLLPDRTCEAPCWQGLRPGAIRPQALTAWTADPPHGWRVEFFRERGTPPGFTSWQVTPPGGSPFYLTMVRIGSPYGDRLQLTDDGVAVGDIIAALGAPDLVEFQVRPGPHSIPRLDIDLYYRTFSLIVQSEIPLDSAYLSADVPVASLVYDTKPERPDLIGVRWRGFGSLARYPVNGLPRP